MKKIFFESITNLLNEKNINVKSTLKNNDFFYRLNTLDNSNKNDLTFFHNNKYFETLKKKQRLKLVLLKMNSLWKVNMRYGHIEIIDNLYLLINMELMSYQLIIKD